MQACRVCSSFSVHTGLLRRDTIMVCSFAVQHGVQASSRLDALAAEDRAAQADKSAAGGEIRADTALKAEPVAETMAATQHVAQAAVSVPDDTDEVASSGALALPDAATVRAYAVAHRGGNGNAAKADKGAQSSKRVTYLTATAADSDAPGDEASVTGEAGGDEHAAVARRNGACQEAPISAHDAQADVPGMAQRSEAISSNGAGMRPDSILEGDLASARASHGRRADPQTAARLSASRVRTLMPLLFDGELSQADVVGLPSAAALLRARRATAQAQTHACAIEPAACTARSAVSAAGGSSKRRRDRARPEYRAAAALHDRVMAAEETRQLWGCAPHPVLAVALENAPPPVSTTDNETQVVLSAGLKRPRHVARAIGPLVTSAPAPARPRHQTPRFETPRTAAREAWGTLVLSAEEQKRLLQVQEAAAQAVPPADAAPVAGSNAAPKAGSAPESAAAQQAGGSAHDAEAEPAAAGAPAPAAARVTSPQLRGLVTTARRTAWGDKAAVHAVWLSRLQPATGDARITWRELLGASAARTTAPAARGVEYGHSKRLSSSGPASSAIRTVLASLTPGGHSGTPMRPTRAVADTPSAETPSAAPGKPYESASGSRFAARRAERKQAVLPQAAMSQDTFLAVQRRALPGQQSAEARDLRESRARAAAAPQVRRQCAAQRAAAAQALHVRAEAYRERLELAATGKEEQDGEDCDGGGSDAEHGVGSGEDEAARAFESTALSPFLADESGAWQQYVPTLSLHVQLYSELQYCHFVEFVHFGS
jgi:hypothetical protein